MSTAYTVHAPPGEDAPERYAFLKDGISWPALFFPILWILWHRLWLTLIGYLVFIVLIAWTGRLWDEQIATILAVIGGVLFALEGNNLRRLSLGRRGWRDVGSSFGKNIAEAEIRFFGDRNRVAPPANPEERAEHGGLGSEAPFRGARPSQRSDQAILGLFPEPER